MKKIIKNYSILLFALLGLLFAGCEKDLYDDVIQVSNKPIIQKISLKEIYLSGTNQKLIDAVQKLRIKNYEAKTNEKLVYNENYGFYIDDQNGKYVDENGEKTYTFQIYRDYITEKTENIVFKLNENNEYETYLSKYLLTAEQKEKISKDEYVDLSNIDVDINNLNDTDKCGYWAVDHIIPDDQGSIVFWVWVPCGGGQDAVVAGTDGTGYTGPESSGNGANGTGNTANGTNGTTTNSTGTNGAGIHGGTGVYTTPVSTPSVMFVQSLGISQEVMLNLPQEVQESIFRYLTIHNFDNVTSARVRYFLLHHINYYGLETLPEDSQVSIFNYFAQNNYSTVCATFVNWGVNYLIQNPTVTFTTFQNQFMGTTEGFDGDYDATYWNNPSLTLPPQNLPTMNDFLLAFPSHNDVLFDTPLKMYNAIGGIVATYYVGVNSNTCAIRVSRALNYSGITIPHIANQTFLGGDGKYYFLGAANINAWMTKTFGPATHHFTGVQGGLHGENFSTLLQGIEGIYVLIPNIPGGCGTPATSSTPAISGTGFCATGHADMYIADGCDGHCYFNATGGVKDIFFWVLP
jgi:hypothetical protein